MLGLKRALTQKDSELSREHDNRQKLQKSLEDTQRAYHGYKDEVKSLLDELKASGQIKAQLEQDILNLQGEVSGSRALCLLYNFKGPRNYQWSLNILRSSS